jgi:hypothetical protein
VDETERVMTTCATCNRALWSDDGDANGNCIYCRDEKPKTTDDAASWVFTRAAEDDEEEAPAE